VSVGSDSRADETDGQFIRALQIFSELAQSYKERGVGLYFVHMRKSQLDAFMNIGIHHIVSTTRLLDEHTRLKLRRDPDWPQSFLTRSEKRYKCHWKGERQFRSRGTTCRLPPRVCATKIDNAFIRSSGIPAFSTCCGTARQLERSF
jgi:hypothetical protein